MTFLVSPSVALAGGPTSVIITSPAEQKAAALYTSQADYGRLMGLVGNNPVADPQAPDLHGGPGSRSIRLTWLIHDVQVWRVDHVFLDLPDGVWIETSMVGEEGMKFDQPGVAHRPADQHTLRKLLYSILNPAPEATAQVRTAATEPPPPPPAAEGIQWTSLLIGAVCGVVILLAGRAVFGMMWRRSA
ncbi:hypothetical protein DMH04_06495 [Kibdelosporangium aridum]|uniref:Uncharacterized protein n=2 Tax=Kibdelosporangium aridum TaxID=2030 RepID=A0A428ZNI7_KIBAR|nr:hypothetical protein DMH04_06495 [Kibdelosporangium aridum]